MTDPRAIAIELAPAQDAGDARAPVASGSKPPVPASASTAKTNLFDLDRASLERFFEQDLGEKKFRAHQVMKWIHHRYVTDFAEMTDLGKALRAKLEGSAEVRVPQLVFDKASADGTHKWLLGMDPKNAIETVYIPDKGRGTLCVSSQVGCALNCTFCSTATQGFNRNLSTAEIIGQVWVAARHLGNVPHQQRRLHDREDRCVRADAECEGNENRRGEDGLSPKRPKSHDDVAAEVGPELVEVSHRTSRNCSGERASSTSLCQRSRLRAPASCSIALRPPACVRSRPRRPSCPSPRRLTHRSDSVRPPRCARTMPPRRARGRMPRGRGRAPP